MRDKYKNKHMVEGNLFLHFSKWMFSKEYNQLFVPGAVLFCNIGAFAQTIENEYEDFFDFIADPLNCVFGMFKKR